jgi:hypothetical protein
MVDAADLKSASRKGVWVRVPPSAVRIRPWPNTLVSNFDLMLQCAIDKSAERDNNSPQERQLW